MPLILSGNVASATAGAYSVANSCRFYNDTLMTMTPSGSPTNADINTLSMWVKIAGLGTNRAPIFADDNGSGVNFRTDDKIDLYSAGGSLRTNQVFRDTSAWYHLVFTTDTTDGTADDRLKIYVNGSQVTSFVARTNPSLNADSHLGSANEHSIGASNTPSNNFNGYMSEFVFIDGQALTPTSFGEFDEDSPTIWKPKDVSGLTFGTNGFYLDFEDSADLGADVSGNSNDFTVDNLAATDQATDTPTNNFCTFNPLDVTADDEPALSEGNLKAVADGAFHQQRSTFYLTSGKWFWEYKATSVGTALQGGVVGSNYAAGSGLRRNYSYNGKKYTDDSSSSYGDTYVADDIIGVALNLDDGELKFYKNGTVQNSGTAAYTDMLSAMGGDGWTPDMIIYDSTVEMNFGGGTPSAISSGNADDNGYGNFEYDVPTGYYALCTKNLAEFGG